jgi:hypothetical protein
MSNGKNTPKENGGNETDAVIVTEIEICGCTNTALERGDTCGQANCPNLNISDEERALCRREFGTADCVGDEQPPRNPRLLDGEGIAAVPTVEGRVDGQARDLLDAHPEFDRNAFAWVGSEHLGGGIFCASVYTGTAADSPYLWITTGEESDDGFLACVWIGDPAGLDQPDDPFLVAECSAEDLAAESLRMLDSARSMKALVSGFDLSEEEKS